MERGVKKNLWGESRRADGIGEKLVRIAPVKEKKLRIQVMTTA